MGATRIKESKRAARGLRIWASIGFPAATQALYDETEEDHREKHMTVSTAPVQQNMSTHCTACAA